MCLVTLVDPPWLLGGAGSRWCLPLGPPLCGLGAPHLHPPRLVPRPPPPPHPVPTFPTLRAAVRAARPRAPRHRQGGAVQGARYARRPPAPHWEGTPSNHTTPSSLNNSSSSVYYLANYQGAGWANPSTGLAGFQWISVDFNGFQWICRDRPKLPAGRPTNTSILSRTS